MTLASRQIEVIRREDEAGASRAGSRSFTVELLGARGVGKSTLAKLLAAELSARNLLAETTLSPTVSGKLARHLSTLGDRSRFIYTSLTWRPLSARDLRSFRKRYRRLRFTTSNSASRPGIHLFDEGVFQLIMELQAKTAQKDIWRIARRIARLVPSPDLVIIVEASEEEIAERRRRRGNAGDMLRPHVAPWERTALGHTKDLLTDLLRAGGGPEVISFRNDHGRSAAEAAAELTEHLAIRYAKRSSPVTVTND